MLSMREELRRPSESAWEAALEQADGDPDRIEVVSETEFVVHNRPVPQRVRPEMPTQKKSGVGSDSQ
jgi:hypothetical protein